MNRLLIVGILAISTAPLYAQGQQPDVAKLKADAQKVVSIIKGDKAKNQIFCQIANLGEQIDQEKDRRKAEALLQKMNELEKQLGPEYLALSEATNDVDPNYLANAKARMRFSSEPPDEGRDWPCHCGRREARDRTYRTISPSSAAQTTGASKDKISHPTSMRSPKTFLSPS
jgi:hypothetical protein